jgi:hypothetical protein
MLVFLSPAAAAFAELPAGLRGLFSPAAAAELEKRGELSAMFRENEPLTCAPRLALCEKLRDGVAELKPMFGVEFCVVHKADKPLDTDKELRGIYGTLLGISTLKGLQYYSASRKRMRELFIDAFRVPAPEKRERLPDPATDGPIPPYRLIHTFQHDSTFGENFFSVEYRYADATFLMTMRNTNKIWYGIIPLIDPGNLAYYIIIHPSGEYVLFYSVVCVKGANPFGLMESKTESFYNRIKALDGWFREKSGLF